MRVQFCCARTRLVAWAFASLFTAALQPNAASAAVLQGQVVKVSDGDTLTVLDADKVQHKVRLAGIDAPEKSQAFGNRSKQALSDCAFGRNVEVDYSKSDRYKRKLGKILANGVDCNLNQIKLGMAWHYKVYPLCA